jgi:methionyl-tRNA formyltransferase
MVQEMDAGPVYCKRELSLEGKASEIYLRAGKISWEIIKWIVETRPVPESQVGEVVIFKRRTPEQSQIPLNGPLRQFYDYIRMLDAPTYPKAFIEYGEYTIEFSDAVIDDDNELRANVRITLKGNES